jgi:hypothetical protein
MIEYGGISQYVRHHKGIKMKNSEAKKQGIMTRLKTAFAIEEHSKYEQELKGTEEWARILCQALSSWGLRANILMDYSFPKTAKVEIADSPIHWVHVTFFDYWNPDFGPGVGIQKDLVIPDSRHLPKLEIGAVPRRSNGWIFWGYGKLIDIRWKGNDGGTGISGDQEIKASIMSLINEMGKPFGDDTSTAFLTIYTRPETSCWVISATINVYSFKQEQWRRYESIAKRLLAAILPD